MPWEYNGDEKEKKPADIEDIIKKVFNRAEKGVANGPPGGPLLLIAILLVGWLATGFYIVAPDELGVVKRFGEAIYTTTSGPHWHLPKPIETVLKPKVTQVKRLEIGFRSISSGPPARYQMVPRESMMLTGDENIVNAQFIVQYRIDDPIAYLFNINNQTETVRVATEAAMREVVGKNNIDTVLTSGKNKVQQDCVKRLQDILNSYDAGVTIVAVQLQDVHPPKQVIQSFQDVASAKENKIRMINEAEGYSNEILPKAHGKATQMTNQAQAYKAELVNQATGEVSRFLANLKAYKVAPEITRKRMQLEMMEGVLQDIDKIIIDPKLNRSLLPLLPLEANPQRLKQSSSQSALTGSQSQVGRVK
ncbi:MAG: FtsH protease activity modulator HflK [Deltaproteobacteria bacterium]|nr:MAG: FtsH protease activity modulator HflK [Deltaproteobacteria bacterium]